ncbi:peptide-methionine (S)-S-oxide reductase MsrA [Prochlorococcus sp. MIT 1341]|uniref:peptide-methionine (S)-S-oxide reductase MsrA n=1 Tax=Prochlorococcus sp. MIT 1341 TaxID=3096221 RepID=UPI002A7564BA|nr:peptide-methionine (S)-S-oxide reductase MsrA [Prochlorococcus sp. MIT 1341]
MFSSWFTPKNFRTDKADSEAIQRHAVLDTAIKKTVEDKQEEAFFACGCFWGAEKGFWKLPGIITTAVGYAGGITKDPSYQEVCSGKTGHTEIVRVVWEPEKVDFSDLLKLFWECHDPTQGDRQGNDRGSQYRSAIYTTQDQQMSLALASKDYYQQELISQGLGQITTEIKASQIFYYAEDYHQQYLARPGSRPYCSAMPTGVKLSNFPNSRYKLEAHVWDEYDWSIPHCVLRSNNKPIKL